MDNRNTNRYRMLVVLLAFFESQRANKNWTSIPALARAVADLKAASGRVGEILTETAIPRGTSATTGASAGKAACLKALVPAAYIIAAALHTYAVDHDEADWAAQTNVSESGLRKMNEPDLVGFCSKISTLAAALVDELEDYDVEPADLTALDKKIQAYANDCPKPRQKLARNRAHNLALPTQFRKARQTMDQRIHKLMAKFKATAPDFYNEYLTARKIVNQAATQGEDQAKEKAKAKPATPAETKAAPKPDTQAGSSPADKPGAATADKTAGNIVPAAATSPDTKVA